MITHDVEQGSSKWLELRARYFTASEAPAMLGLSKYMSRSELLRQKATGLVPDVDAVTQARFDSGHAAEAATRAWAEQFIGEDLFPTTGTAEVDGLPLLASFDGLTMDESINWENKLWNESFAAQVRECIAPDTHWPQMEHQMIVSGASKVLFTISDGDENVVSMWYESVPERRARVLAGWKQFTEDLANYKHVEVIPAAVASPIRDFPAVKYEVVGMSLTSNVASEVKPYVLAEVAKFEKKPETDQEFADLDGFTKKARAAVKKSVLLRETVMAGLVDFDLFFRDMQEVEGILTKAAISGENLFKAEKINRKQALVTKSREEYGEYWSALCKRIGGQWIPTKDVTYWSDAIKGLSSMKSIESELGVALANAKIEANEIADRIEANKKLLKNDTQDFWHLFPDFAQVCAKATEDFELLVGNRFAAQVERENTERARIQAEERAKAEREAAAKIEAARIEAVRQERERAEQEAKAKAEEDQRGKASTEDVKPVAQTGNAADREDEETQVAKTSTPPAPIDQRAAVVEHQDEIAAFMASREFKNPGSVRAILVEFVKFQSTLKGIHQ